MGGDYAFRIRGETHAWNPDTVADLQHAVRGQLPRRSTASFAKTNLNDQSERLMTIRGLFRSQGMRSEIGRHARCRWTKSSQRS